MRRLLDVAPIAMCGGRSRRRSDCLCALTFIQSCVCLCACAGVRACVYAEHVCLFVSVCIRVPVPVC